MMIEVDAFGGNDILKLNGELVACVVVIPALLPQMRGACAGAR